jgi:hypothetical protein
MKKNRLIFYLIFGAFHLFIFFFSLYMDSNKDNFQVLIQMQKSIWLIKYGSMIGLVLLVIDVVWLMRGEKDHAVEKKNLEHELNTLKAKLFDLQEAAKQQNIPPRV